MGAPFGRCGRPRRYSDPRERWVTARWPRRRALRRAGRARRARPAPSRSRRARRPSAGAPGRAGRAGCSRARGGRARRAARRPGPGRSARDRGRGLRPSSGANAAGRASGTGSWVAAPSTTPFARTGRRVHRLPARATVEQRPYRAAIPFPGIRDYSGTRVAATPEMTYDRIGERLDRASRHGDGAAPRPRVERRDLVGEDRRAPDGDDVRPGEVAVGLPSRPPLDAVHEPELEPAGEAPLQLPAQLWGSADDDEPASARPVERGH